jgi:chitin synthase
MLQRGFRVVYTAASDSFTFAPESFAEFFKQRRRWLPSTLANNVDLLRNAKRTTQNNSDISKLFMWYQQAIFVSSVITPGTIFLLLVGAISDAFPDVSLLVSFVINIIPLFLFVLLCYKGKQDTQVNIF